MKVALVMKEPALYDKKYGFSDKPLWYDTIRRSCTLLLNEFTRQRFCYTSAPTTFSYSLQLQLAIEHWFFGLDLHGMKDVGDGGGKSFCLR